MRNNNIAYTWEQADMQKDGGAGGLHYMSDGTLPTTVQEFHALAVSEGALLTMLNDAMVSLLLVGYEAMPNGVKGVVGAIDKNS